MNRSFCIELALCLALLGFISEGNAGEPATTNHFTCVLVHGAWCGGWAWKHVDELLTADGNKVYRPTLTGQGERSHLAGTNIDLDTHIQDIVNVILWEDLHDVVLVGHSYGGMVITGVADRVPDRIRPVVYIDAFLPENGESANAGIRPGVKLAMTNDFIPPTWVKGNPPPPHDVPMPARAFSQPITLTNQAVAQKLPSTYILLLSPDRPPEQAMFYRFYERAKARGWPVWTMESDHNVHLSHPKELVQLLEKAAPQR
jgi:pimeloyl-ACP methyl ester carboxylesterase